MSKNFELLVIGSGPGGYVAAIRASQLGMKVGIIERESLGGVCLNWGCIPTKALLRSAEIYQYLKNAEEFGLSCEMVKADLPKVVARSRDIAGKLSRGIAGLMMKNKVEVMRGHAKLVGNGEIVLHEVTAPQKYTDAAKVGNKIEEIKAKHIIIATGARPRELPNLKIDHDRVWDYKDAMMAKKLPKSLLVVGSGAIGVEFATFYNALGTKVTIIDIAARILINEDEEIAKIAHKAFVGSGIEIYTEATIEKIEKEFMLIKCNSQEIKIECEHIISAVGVVPNTQDIGLENTRVKLLQNGHIEVDEYLRTAESGIYAIGDVTAPPLLAHKASHEAIICVESIAKLKTHPLVKNNIPACTYSHPQIASIGYTEKKAIAAGFEIEVGKFSLMGNGKALTLGGDSCSGMIKKIYDKKTGELLGAHMIGPEVTELIHSMAIIKNAELTEEDVMATVFPHPTLSESLHEATLAAFGRVLHM